MPVRGYRTLAVTRTVRHSFNPLNVVLFDLPEPSALHRAVRLPAVYVDAELVLAMPFPIDQALGLHFRQPILNANPIAHGDFLSQSKWYFTVEVRLPGFNRS